MVRGQTGGMRTVRLQRRTYARSGGHDRRLATAASDNVRVSPLGCSVWGTPTGRTARRCLTKCTETPRPRSSRCRAAEVHP